MKESSSDLIAASTVAHQADKSAGSGRFPEASGVICARSAFLACTDRCRAEPWSIASGDLVLGGPGYLFWLRKCWLAALAL